MVSAWRTALSLTVAAMTPAEPSLQRPIRQHPNAAERSNDTRTAVRSR